MLYDSIEMLEGSEIQNLTIASGTTFPIQPDTGELFFRTTSNKMYVYDGSAWIQVGDAADANVVSSVAGKIGDVTLSAVDISGLAAVATAGSYASLTGKPNLAAVATSGSYADLTNKPSIPAEYVLEPATAVTLGGVKAGSGTSIDGTGVLSITFPTNSQTASALQTARNIAVSGDVTGSASFDGSQNVSISASLTNTGVTSGTFTKVTVDYKGRVTAASAANNADVVASLGFSPENISNKNVANGYAGLDSTGKLASSQLPALAITDTFVVASQSAMLALSTAEIGDIAVRTDLNKSFILKDATASVLASWQELLTPTIPSTTLSGDITGSGLGAITTTLATVNSTPGTFGSSSSVPVVTIDAKGRITSVSSSAIPAAPVTSVAGKIGAVSLVATDISGFATVATTGSYVDLTNKPTIPAEYSLPVATAAVLGGVKQGTGNTIAGDGTLSINFPANSSTATALQTARTINGVAFDGSTNITVAAAAGTLTGASLAAGVTGSSLTSVGNITSGTWSATLGAISGAALTAITGANVTGSVASATLAATANALNAANAYTAASFNSITGLSASVGAAAGTAAAGTSTAVARADHVHPLQTTIVGGSVNSSPVGNTAPSTGAFTTLAASGTSTFNGTAVHNGLTTVQGMLEKANITGSAPGATQHIDVLSNAVYFANVNAGQNFTLNVRGNSTTSLDSTMATGQSLTIAFLLTNGPSPFYATAYTIDGTTVTPKWNGTAPVSGNANSIDSYSLTIIKTAAATFTVLANRVKFA